MSAPGDPQRVIRARVEEERLEDRVRRRVIFGVPGEQERTLLWDITGPAPALPSPLVRHDLAAGALIYLAMRENCGLHIEGPVSQRLLINLDRFQCWWRRWRPDLYNIVPLSADAEIIERPAGAARDRTAVITFSGGVDSTATIYRHHAGLAERETRRIKTAVLVKGFDVPLDRVEGWQVVVDGVARTLADIETPLCIVETNWRAVTDSDWPMEHGAAIISCLRHWDEDADSLIMAADHNYRDLVIPWGSNPITNPLLEGEATSIPFDGGELTRTEKVALISGWPAGFNGLRVCYTDDVSGRNCGVCGKCVMTKLNAIVLGLAVPASLYGPPTVAEIKKLKSVGPLLAETLSMADAKGVKSPLFDALRARKRALEIAGLGQRAVRKAKHIMTHGRW